MIGFVAGIPKIPLNLVLLKGAQIVGVFWGSFTPARPSAIKPTFAAHGLVLGREARAAGRRHLSVRARRRGARRPAARRVKGKVVLVP